MPLTEVTNSTCVDQVNLTDSDNMGCNRQLLLAANYSYNGLMKQHIGFQSM